jgi:hypothetical protein
MPDERFPYEQSEWRGGESRRWNETLERYGHENVRAVLLGAAREARTWISIGTVMDIPKDFAQEWLAWHDRSISLQQMARRDHRVFWITWAVLAACAVAIAGTIGWIVVGSKSLY